MTERPQRGMWSSADAYEAFIGRWSRLVARPFLAWLAAPSGGAWLDVGCGSGALSEAILATQGPASLRSIDPSQAFVASTRERIRDARATIAVGRAEQIEAASDAYDAVVSGLVLNFVPAPADAAREFARVVRPGGTVGVYVWDYADGMRMLRLFWDAATALDPAAAQFDEGRQFSMCDPDRLRELFEQAGLSQAGHRAIDVAMQWRDFDDFWAPFLGGTGTAPAYVASLSGGQRVALRERLRATVPVEHDGSIRMLARAWAVKGGLP